MRRVLLHSAAFTRAVRRLGRKNHAALTDLREALEMLEQDAFQPRLRTHKLKGDLSGLLACSAGYDLRIIFSIVPHSQTEGVLLVSCGTRDDVY